MAKSSRRPSSLISVASPAVGDEVPANGYDGLHPLFGRYCHVCISAPVVATANTSRRPSALLMTDGAPVTPLMSGYHADQMSPAPSIIHLCHTVLSLRRANTSSRPSWLRLTVTALQKPGVAAIS